MPLDHLVITAPSLEAGLGHVKSRLGIDMPRGGEHPDMGTHNHLLRLDADIYLEVIAVDPDARKPGHPRWFNLDRPSSEPKLVHWVVRHDDLDEAVKTAHASVGRPRLLRRGSLAWRLTVPDDGSLPFDGAHPSLIEWPLPSRPDRPRYPGAAMPDFGCNLKKLVIRHPNALKVEHLLSDLIEDERIRFEAAPDFQITATIATPSGVCTIS